MTEPEDGSRWWDGWGHGGSPAERHWIVTGSLTFRALAMPANAVALAVEGPRGWWQPLVAAALVTAVVSGVGAVRLRPSARRRRGLVVTLLVVDAVSIVALCLWRASHPDVTPDETSFSLFWPLAQGAVTLWLAVFGLPVAVAVLLLGAPLYLAMVVVSPSATLAQAWPTLFLYLSWLSLALGVAAAVRVMIRSRAMLALAEGVAAGRRSEHDEAARLVHDTALQSLEAITLMASGVPADPARQRERLDLIAEAAREEATQVRQRIEGGPRGDLLHELSAVVTGARMQGLPVRLHRTGLAACRPPAVVSDACWGVTLESLRNARQHAGASRVDVTVDVSASRVGVSVSDDGVGFDPSTTTGFGLRESLGARVRDVGGELTVRSATGRGTSITAVFDWGATVGGAGPRPAALRSPGLLTPRRT